jgi:outer membrane protein assembly factor BamE (lipoprotein component of BamABCDE complex)
MGDAFPASPLNPMTMHKHIFRTAAAAALVLTLSACSTFSRTPAPGTPLADVTAKLGKPDAVYPDPNGGQVLEYRGQPMGQFQHMARFGADGRLVSYDQVLTSENFAKIQPGRWMRDDVLRTFGRPAETGRDRVSGFESWSYRYKQDGVWNAYMNVYFNGRGEVHHTENTPDPMLDDRAKGF